MTLPCAESPPGRRRSPRPPRSIWTTSTAISVYLTRDRSLAEDLAADTFEKALKQWRRFDSSRGSARAWLCQIARTTALDWFRAEERRRKREARVAVPDLIDGGLSPGLSPSSRALCRSFPPASAR